MGNGRNTRVGAWRSALIVMCLAVGTVAVAAQDQAAAELAKLEGGWMVVAAEQRGKPFDVIKGGALIVEGKTFYIKTAAGNEFRGELRLDPSKSPKQLDFVHAGSGMVWEAIYSLDEETFRFNYVEAGGRDLRPTLFATSADGPGLLIVMNRLIKQ